MARSTRIVIIIGAFVLMLPLLAACGGGGDSDDPAEESAATPTSEHEGHTTPTAAADDSTPATSPTADDGAITPAEDAGVEGTTAPDTATPTTAPSGSTEPTTPPATGSGDSGGFAYGWNVAVRGDENGQDHNLTTGIAVQKIGFGWVRFQMEWSQFQAHGPESWNPLPMDRVIQDLSSSGLNILIVVAKAPDWALDPSGNRLLADYGDFERFMEFVSDRYAGKVEAWEIWNEQNLAHEVNGTVRAADYVELLKAGFTGVRSGDPEAKVVFGGLTPNGVNDPSIAIDDVQYLTEVYEANNGEVKDYFDIMGAHVSATQTTPDNSWPDNPGPEGWSDHPSFYFRRAEELRQVMVDHGDSGKSMWLTEFGWTTENQAPGYEYGANNSPEEVAQYLTRSFEIMTTEWDWVSGAFIWNLNWSTLTDPADEKYPWSAVNSDWSPRPAFDAMRDLPKS